MCMARFYLEYRGAAPIQWCLYNGGKTKLALQTMLMDAGMDTGCNAFSRLRHP